MSLLKYIEMVLSDQDFIDNICGSIRLSDTIEFDKQS